MSITTIPSHLKGFPHGIDLSLPGAVDQLIEHHRAWFGDAQMNANAGAGDSGGSGGGESSGKQKQEDRTFTQEEVNAFLAEQKRKQAEKFSDYEALKAKAEKFDQAEQESQTELQRAVARAEKAEKAAADERAGREAAERQSLAATVAAEKGVPASHISGGTREELETSADQLIAWRTGQETQQQEPPKVGGHVPFSGTGATGPQPVTMQSGREQAMAKHAKNTN